MRTLIIIMCAAAVFTSAGCDNQWKMKWPGSSAATTQPAPGPTALVDQPELTPQQENAQLRRQISTLRDRLDMIENENTKLRKDNTSVTKLKSDLKLQKLTSDMQAQDLKVLKAAAIERDFYKTKSEGLEKELKDLHARVAKLLERRAKAATPKPAGT
ncbi:MAG: hypothetical protein HN350_20210 [Phycisphaerales bacterium]|jgi:TolA-binding protein|nr:hypothetical protein [Phycisphaerales bacterium]